MPSLVLGGRWVPPSCFFLFCCLLCYSFFSNGPHWVPLFYGLSPCYLRISALLSNARHHFPIVLPFAFYWLSTGLSDVFNQVPTLFLMSPLILLSDSPLFSNGLPFDFQWAPFSHPLVPFFLLCFPLFSNEPPSFFHRVLPSFLLPPLVF